MHLSVPLLIYANMGIFTFRHGNVWSQIYVWKARRILSCSNRLIFYKWIGYMAIYNRYSEDIYGPWLLNTVCCDKRSQYVRDHRAYGVDVTTLEQHTGRWIKCCLPMTDKRIKYDLYGILLSNESWEIYWHIMWY